tara:strand:- start:358 stop:1290 length:933 start_codon:yes stop_codon:yes gene_type:complete
MTTKGLQEGAEKSQKEPDVYRCEKCDFFTSKLGNWKRHLKTKKHSCPQMTTDDYKRTTKKEEKGAVAKSNFICECGKSYANRQNLYRHQKKCNFEVEKPTVVTTTDSSAAESLKEMVGLMKEVVNKNCELVEKLATNTLNAGYNNTCGSYNNTNSNNNIFNIQLFLNENCANAMSIQDFAKKLTVEMSDLDMIENDEPKAIVGMIKKSLSGLSQNERPLHSHEKRWYVKDHEEGWEDDNSGKAVDVVKAGAAKSLSRLANEKYNTFMTDGKSAEAYAEAISKVNSDVDIRSKKVIKSNLTGVCSLKDKDK